MAAARKRRNLRTWLGGTLAAALAVTLVAPALAGGGADVSTEAPLLVAEVGLEATAAAGAGYVEAAPMATALHTGYFMTPGGAPWTIYSDGRLEIGAGNVSGAASSSDAAVANLPWRLHAGTYDVVFTAPVTAAANMNFFFASTRILSISGLDYLDTSNTRSMVDMFRGNSGLTSLDVSGFDTSNVTNMSAMFQALSGLTSLDVSGFDTSNVTNMSSMFFGTSGLAPLGLSNWDTSRVTNMSHMFRSSRLPSLDLSNWDTSR
ncbi:MAG: BspA family leucine-rich repeat surface protein, partial [Promicromonosporaceae bacterium]|nr:BspA family leucine-rich repeat surface protein [Promicromonosporaceae bacterium]